MSINAIQGLTAVAGNSQTAQYSQLYRSIEGFIQNSWNMGPDSTIGALSFLQSFAQAAGGQYLVNFSKLQADVNSGASIAQQLSDLNTLATGPQPQLSPTQINSAWKAAFSTFSAYLATPGLTPGNKFVGFVTLIANISSTNMAPPANVLQFLQSPLYQDAISDFWLRGNPQTLIDAMQYASSLFPS